MELENLNRKHERVLDDMRTGRDVMRLHFGQARVDMASSTAAGRAAGRAAAGREGGRRMLPLALGALHNRYQTSAHGKEYAE
jgi:hypothetical protein